MSQFVKKADRLGSVFVQNIMSIIFGCFLVFTMVIIDGLCQKNRELEERFSNAEFRCKQLTQHANDYKRELEFADKQISNLQVKLIGEYKRSCWKLLEESK